MSGFGRGCAEGLLGERPAVVISGLNADTVAASVDIMKPLGPVPGINAVLETLSGFERPPNYAGDRFDIRVRNAGVY
jgi:hypothetical protein